MYIKNILLKDSRNYPLDMDKIGNVSKEANEIALPYTGDLPELYETATLFVNVLPMDVQLALFSELDGETIKYAVSATQEEIRAILEPFFFERKGNIGRTRFDNGLSEYRLGYFQARYLLWNNLVTSPSSAIYRELNNLTKEQVAEVYERLEYVERAKSAS